MAYLRITDGKGFQATLGNDLTISVQIGRGNYSDNYGFRTAISADNPLPPSTCAEIAVWDVSGTWLEFDEGEVKGYVPVDDVFRFIGFLQSLPDDLTIVEVRLACKGFDWRKASA